MLRNLAAALALLLLSQTAFGLGLGTLKQSSALNEPFDGRVEILGANARDAETISVKLADETQFERAGVLRNAVLLQLRFNVVDSGSSDYIQITSREAIREPFLNFLLELNWANGRVVREYTVLLDPPLYDPVRPRPSAPATPVVEQIAQAAPVTEAAPAPAPAPAPSEPAPMLAVEAPTASPSMPGPEAGATLGTVQSNDTLWSLASNNLADSSVSVQQMMLALLRTNPEAFGDGNINILRRGAVLRMPGEDALTALTRSEAIAEVQRQHQLWNDYRGMATESVAEAPLVGEPDMAALPETDDVAPAADPVDETVAAIEEAVDDPRLELVAPGSDDEQMGAGDGTTGAADVTLTREELDAQMQANNELQARIAEADEIIDLMRRQVDIKDDELAALQSRLAELGIDAPADLMPGATDEPEIIEEDVMAGPDGPIEDDEHVVMRPGDEIPDVDITFDEPEVTEPEQDTDVVGMVDDGDTSVAIGDGDDGITDDGGGDAGAGSLLGGLIPAHIANMVPGGAMTVLGIVGAVLLAIIIGLFKLLGGRRGEVAEDAAGIATDADDATAVTELAEEDEPITETREGDEEPTAGADQDTLEAEAFEGDVPAEMQATSPDLQATIESTAEDLAPQAPVAEPDDDPLEEVNVYLAYERFDQAEELVRKVIGEHPDEHKYKLRLLEVYYSSNDKPAYEEAAREMYEAVGDEDPLWESAVAMWAEMSPERALFEEGGAAEAAPAEDAASAFVDITAEDEDAGAKTMSMAPGSDSVLESTQVGLAPLADDDDGALDFDLGANADGDGGDGGDDGMLDLTGGMDDEDGAVLDLTAATDDDDVFDLTATTGEAVADDDLLDLTATTDESAADAAADASVLDFTLDEDPAGADALDIGADTTSLAESEDLLDVTAPELRDGHDLLDVTKTGELASGEPEDILNVTSPGLMSDDEPGSDDDILDISGDGSSIDFDISDTVAPAFGADDEAVSEDESGELIDITTSTPDDGGGDVLDFDIGGLGGDDVTAEFAADDADTLDITGGADAADIAADIEADAREMLEDSLELDIPDTQEDSVETVEMEAIPLVDTQAETDEDTAPLDLDVSTLEGDAQTGAATDFDLSLQSAELDELSIGADTIGEDTTPIGDDEESEIEFDLALQDTTEMDSLVIDDTLELPKTQEPDETLDDLTKSMEESMAELDIDDDELDLDDDGELDLSLADTTSSLDLDLDDGGDSDEDAPSLDFDINDLDIGEMDQADTIAMDLSIADTTGHDEQTVVMPVDETVEMQSDADEIDTKLNLAKAYIELGDNDGARSILDEVSRDGSEGQQTEAQRLIDQLS